MTDVLASHGPELGGVTLDNFDEHVAAGGYVGPTDPMPEGYRKQITGVMSFQAIAEIVGETLFSEWLGKVPALMRKTILTAKCQDELGHAQVMMRALEDLGVDRDSVVEDYLEGRTKLLNVFHYRIENWLEVPGASLLQNSAAVVQFKSLVQGSYLPYVRALKKIMREESFHFHQAIDLTTLIHREGNEEQRRLLQEGFNKWFPLVLAYFGPPDRQKGLSDSMRWRIKVDYNDDLRRRWLDKIVPVVEDIGLDLYEADPNLHRREDGTWEFTEPDWEEVKKVLKGNGPASEMRKEIIARRYEHNRWLRLALSEVA